MIRLHVIIGSVRPVRVGLPVGLWVEAQAKADGRFEVTLVDLAEVNLPFLDEPEMPHLGKYTHEHTKAWSRTIDAADAFIFVMPEYNAGVSPALKNALDFLSAEWKHKAVGLVSYGGISGGQRGGSGTEADSSPAQPDAGPGRGSDSVRLRDGRRRW